MSQDNQRVQPPPPENGDVNRELYTEFGALLERYCEGIKGVLSADGEREQVAVLGVLRQSLNAQSNALAEAFYEMFDRQDIEGQAVIVKYIKSTGALELVANTSSLMSDSSMNQKSLLSWIILILEILKEIIVMLGHLLHLPDSVIEFILGILDILDKILKLLSQFLGSRAADIANRSDQIFWESLQRFWRTTAALKMNGLPS